MSNPSKAQNIWQNEEGNDFLALQNKSTGVFGGIDNTGTPYGSMAVGSSGGIASVKTDATLTGTGTPTNPLSVVNSPTIVQTGLLAQYRILSTESAASLRDYSGNGNNATGTVGVAPAIISGTGGISCAGNGAVKLPAALNSSLTIMVMCALPNVSGGEFQCPVSSNGGGSNGNNVGISLGTGLEIESIVNNANGQFTDGWWNGVGVVTLAMANPDVIYINNVPTFIQQNIATGAGVTTVGEYQLGGSATGFQYGSTYFYGQVYYALFYNRVLTAVEVAQNVIAMKTELTNRGLSNVN